MIGVTIRHSAAGIHLTGAAGSIDLTPMSPRQLSDVAHLVCQAAGIRDKQPMRRTPRPPFRPRNLPKE